MGRHRRIDAQPLPPGREHVHSPFVHVSFLQEGPELLPSLRSAGCPHQAVDTVAPRVSVAGERLPCRAIGMDAMPAPLKRTEEPPSLLLLPHWVQRANACCVSIACIVRRRPGWSTRTRSSIVAASLTLPTTCSLTRPVPPLLRGIALVPYVRACRVCRCHAASSDARGTLLWTRVMMRISRVLGPYELVPPHLWKPSRPGVPRFLRGEPVGTVETYLLPSTKVSRT